MSQMRVGIMSFAHHHAERYAELLSSMGGVDLVGFSDDDADRARRVTRQYGLRNFGTGDVLLEQNLDAVIVCSENIRHCPDVQLAADAGVPVLCEKPFATAVADALSMQERCERNHVSLRTAFPMRFSEPIQRVQAAVASGRLGQIRFIEGLNQGQMPDAHRSWFVDPSLSGGGAITDHAVHLLDVFRWILDDEPISVYAQANQRVGDPGLSLETCGLLAIAFERGTLATIDCSWSRPACFPTWGGLSFTLTGTSGSAEVDAFGRRLSWIDDRDRRLTWDDWGPDADLAMLEDFLSVARGEPSPVSNAADGLRGVELVVAAYASLRTNRVVALDNSIEVPRADLGEHLGRVGELSSDQIVGEHRIAGLAGESPRAVRDP